MSEANKTLGILGGGQLGKMMAQEAVRMGVRVRFLSNDPQGPMQHLGERTVGDWKDTNLLRSFAERCDAVTVESEWAPADRLAEVLPEDTALWPRPRTLELIRHKGVQTTTLDEAGLPLPLYRLCATLEDALIAAGDLGYPLVCKRYEGSYDGYGNATAESDEELEQAWNDLAAEDGMLVEAFVPFVRELSVLVARRSDGAHVVYPVAYTEQREHRCHAVVVPAPITDDVRQEAQRVGLAAVEAVDGIGLTAVELFELEDGRVLVNELAPRPHNTGHYSIEACHTSQFENHVRAVLGWPLGDPSLRVQHAVMVNILGQREGTAKSAAIDEALAVPGAAVHIYGKPDVRRNRKMGHVTCTGPDPDDARDRAERAAALVRL